MKYIDDPIILFEKLMPGLASDRIKNILFKNDICYQQYHFYYTVIFPTFRCNHNCIYCYNFFDKKKARRQDIVKLHSENKELIRLRDYLLINAGIPKLTIAGGEPTLTDDYLELVRLAKKNGVDEIKIQTNGYGFSNKNFLLENMHAGITKIDLHIPSFDKKIFEAITRNSRSYNNVIISLKNLKETGYIKNTVIVCIINKLNYEDLPKYIEFIIRNCNNIIGVNLFYVLKGNDAIDDTSILPRLNDMSVFLYDALGIAKHYKLKLFIDYIPLCYLKDYYEFSVDLLHFSLGKEFPDSFNTRTKTLKCSSCKLNGICFGPTIDYVKLYGDDELIPYEEIPVELANLIK